MRTGFIPLPMARQHPLVRAARRAPGRRGLSPPGSRDATIRARHLRVDRHGFLRPSQVSRAHLPPGRPLSERPVKLLDQAGGVEFQDHLHASGQGRSRSSVQSGQVHRLGPGGRTSAPSLLDQIPGHQPRRAVPSPGPEPGQPYRPQFHRRRRTGTLAVRPPPPPPTQHQPLRTAWCARCPTGRSTRRLSARRNRAVTAWTDRHHHLVGVPRGPSHGSAAAGAGRRHPGPAQRPPRGRGCRSPLFLLGTWLTGQAPSPAGPELQRPVPRRSRPRQCGAHRAAQRIDRAEFRDEPPGEVGGVVVASATSRNVLFEAPRHGLSSTQSAAQQGGALPSERRG